MKDHRRVAFRGISRRDSEFLLVVPTVVYGTANCSDCHLARKTLDALGVPYEWIDLADKPDTVPLVIALNRGSYAVPTIVLSDGTVLVEPDADELTGAIKRAEASPES